MSRVIICGSRTLGREHLLNALRECKWSNQIKTVISGGAKGIDTEAALYAARNKISKEIYPAKWRIHGRRAGPIRNQQMIDEGKPDSIIAVWDGDSPGTADMLRRTDKAKLRTFIYMVSKSGQSYSVGADSERIYED